MDDVKNRLVLAVAGGRKTQGIIDNCLGAESDKRILVLTYTVANQKIITGRLRGVGVTNPHIEVMGWYSFILNEIIRPFLPFAFRGKRIRGFEFDGPYQRGIGKDEWRRYVNEQDDVRKVHAAHLAHQIIEASGADAISRLEKVYDKIYVDEVQDLCGYDLDVITSILKSTIEIEMVGDIRQAILATNPQERRNKQYKFMRILDWFRRLETDSLIEIVHRSQTWRCRPEVAEFADRLFTADWGFGTTESLNVQNSDHDGVFLISPENVEIYANKYSPLVMRSSANSGREWNHLSPHNFGITKGRESERVLIIPTAPIKSYLQKGKPLDEGQSAHLYVAVTRARQSVAFILDQPKDCRLPYWEPA